MTTSDDLKTLVKEKYNALARDKQDCCATEDCSFIGDSYEGKEGYVREADLGLGCGLPTEFAGIKPGHVVVDLGSGAGNDAFIARGETGETGRVIGVDMATDMIARANQNLTKLGFTNVEFRLGDIEDIPLANETADVVVSNCVMNLVPDKRKAFAETFRILRPGGHFSISDVVTRGSLPGALREAAELYVGCVGGAITQGEYLDIIAASGFSAATIQKSRKIELPQDILDEIMEQTGEQLPGEFEGIYSITVSAQKPAKDCCGSGCCK